MHVRTDKSMNYKLLTCTSKNLVLLTHTVVDQNFKLCNNNI